MNNQLSQPSFFRCVLGSVIAGSLSYGCYLMTQSIAQSFAKTAIHSDNITIINLTTAVRTLVVGIVALGTGIFGLAALGLLALGFQILFQQISQPKATNQD